MTWCDLQPEVGEGRTWWDPHFPPLLDKAALGNPEYAFWNVHKWLYGPKSSALMYVRRDRQLLHVPAPSVVDSTETDPFTDRFIWTGTRDRTAYCGEGGF